jgi:hypothetical protein
MRTEKAVEISVKTIFTGGKSKEQIFIELIRRKRAERFASGLEKALPKSYTKAVVFPDVHAR